jgi:NAD(P)-dependent dehydrogenase (short-subunit alcohol dehydrogenase family)
MAGKFAGKVALVTGGSSGIGQAAAVILAAEGAKVVITADKNVAGGNETVAMIKKNGGEAAFVQADVSKAADVKALFARAVELYGGLDCAVNNAGLSGSHKSVADISEEEWDSTVAVDLKGVWLCMKEEILWMREHGGGAIVNVGSSAGTRARPTNADYVASKYGVVGLTKSAAIAYGTDNIRVNLVAPGPTDTPMTRSTIAKPGSGMAEKIGQAIPLGRLATSEEVAEACVWLCSDAARFVTGAVVPVDGGFTDK